MKEFNKDIIGVGGAIINIGDDFWLRSVNLAYGTFLGCGNSVQGKLIRNRRFVSRISGCNSMYHRHGILKAGGFRTSLPGAEDAELNSRLFQRGKLLYLPDTIMQHDHGRGLNGFARQIFARIMGLSLRQRQFVAGLQTLE